MTVNPQRYIANENVATGRARKLADRMRPPVATELVLTHVRRWTEAAPE